uniref:Uncharacterized protein n=1 Tax=Pipistrellus kuhlii TaxID=59472 RepID=A0A7J7X0C1_PIPKU|nr:hypothetical protein mPipKuh1_010744 [Pipistrellus kuhlii]
MTQTHSERHRKSTHRCECPTTTNLRLLKGGQPLGFIHTEALAHLPAKDDLHVVSSQYSYQNTKQNKKTLETMVINKREKVKRRQHLPSAGSMQSRAGPPLKHRQLCQLPAPRGEAARGKKLCTLSVCCLCICSKSLR